MISIYKRGICFGYFRQHTYLLLQQMQVTTSNFGEARKLITQVILPKTEYITFDLEFTGVRIDKPDRDRINYLPYEKYKKFKPIAENYQILQLGISFVAFDPVHKLQIFPFNFYLFPRNPIATNPNGHNINMQLGCTNFNTKNGMDWNKWIREGINYVRISQMETMNQFSQKCPSEDIIKQSYNPQNLQYFEQLKRYTHDAALLNIEKSVEFTIPADSYLLNILTVYFNRYIEQQKLLVGMQLRQDSKNQWVITLKKITKQQLQFYNNLKQEQLLGFTLLMNDIWKTKVDIIGHNCLFDLLYVYAHLIAPLPDDYFLFKKNLFDSGHKFFDTKYIANSVNELRDHGTSLQDLVAYFKSKNSTLNLYLDKRLGNYSLENPNLHEAGYDSYITAWVYQNLLIQLHKDFHLYANKINIQNCFFYINLKSEEDGVVEYYAQNVLRYKIEIKQHERQNLFFIKANIIELIKSELGLVNKKGDAYIHDGYQQLFIEIKANRKNVIEKLMAMSQRYPEFLHFEKFNSIIEEQRGRAIRQYANDKRKLQKANNFKPYKKEYPKKKKESQSMEAESQESSPWKEEKDKKKR